MRGSLCSVELTSSPCTDDNHLSRDWKVSFEESPPLTHTYSKASLDGMPYSRSSPPTVISFHFMPMMTMMRKIRSSNQLEMIGLLLEKTADSVDQYRRSGLLELMDLDEEALYSGSMGLLPIGSNDRRSMSLPNTYPIQTFEIV